MRSTTPGSMSSALRMFLVSKICVPEIGGRCFNVPVRNLEISAASMSCVIFVSEQALGDRLEIALPGAYHFMSPDLHRQTDDWKQIDAFVQQEGREGGKCIPQEPILTIWPS